MRLCLNWRRRVRYSPCVPNMYSYCVLSVRGLVRSGVLFDVRILGSSILFTIGSILTESTGIAAHWTPGHDNAVAAGHFSPDYLHSSLKYICPHFLSLYLRIRVKSVRLLVSFQMSDLSVRLASRRRRAACGPCGRRSRGGRAGRAPVASRAPRFPLPPRGAAARATGRRVCASCGSSSGTARHTASRMATATATTVRLPERFKHEYVLNPSVL